MKMNEMRDTMPEILSTANWLLAKKVILLGHPDPTVAGGEMPDYFTEFMNQYASWASRDANIFFIDTRTWTQYNSWDYFADDQSHPSPLMGTVVGDAVAALISGSAVSDIDSSGADSSPGMPSEPEAPSTVNQSNNQATENDSESNESQSQDSNTGMRFYESMSGSCPSGFYLTTPEQCEMAAEFLGLNGDLRRVFSNARRIRACYRRGSNLFFNRDNTLVDSSTQVSRKSLCGCATANCGGDEDLEEEKDEFDEEEASEIQFFRSSNGSCAGGAYITDVEMCERAGETLGLEMARAFSNRDRLRGCYAKGSRLFFNADASSIRAGGRRTSVCMKSGRRMLKSRLLNLFEF